MIITYSFFNFVSLHFKYKRHIYMRKILNFLVPICLMSCFSCAPANSSSSIKPTSEEPEIDFSRYPNIVEDYSNLSYLFNDAEISNPFWLGNVIYNETVLLSRDSKTGIISGKLAYTPVKILAIKDYTLKTKDYVLNEDYTIDGKVITRTENSSMPFLEDTTLRGEYLPDGYRLVSSISNIATDCVLMGPAYYTESDLYYGNQIQVSYVYDVKEIDPDYNSFPSYKLDSLPHLKAKLEAKQDVKIVGLGDSVLQGCSSSKKFNHEPFMDTFFDMTIQYLDERFDSKITGNNLSVGGTQSSWGANSTQIYNVSQENPDLLILHFGINDLGAGVGANSYIDNMLSIVLEIRNRCPNCDFLILTPFGPNPLIYDYERIDGYINKIKREITDSIQGTALVDVFEVSKKLYENKKYQDMTANGINHVNDYASRIYLQSILSTIVKYK